MPKIANLTPICSIIHVSHGTVPEEPNAISAQPSHPILNPPPPPRRLAHPSRRLAETRLSGFAGAGGGTVLGGFWRNRSVCYLTKGVGYGYFQNIVNDHRIAYFFPIQNA